MVFLSKPGQTDYSSASSFRPICLTSFAFKGMERCVFWDISEHELKDNPLSERQHGFSSGMSTDTALSMMVGRLEKALRRSRSSWISAVLLTTSMSTTPRMRC